MSEKIVNLRPTFEDAKEVVRTLYDAVDNYRANPTEENARHALELEDKFTELERKYDLDSTNAAYEVDHELGYDDPDDNPYLKVLDQLKAEQGAGTFSDNPDSWSQEGYDSHNTDSWHSS